MLLSATASEQISRLSKLEQQEEQETQQEEDDGPQRKKPRWRSHEEVEAELAKEVQRAIRSKLDMRADHDRVRAGFELEDTLTEGK